MHISDGILTETLAGAGVVVAASLVAVTAVGYSLRRLDYEKIPRVAVLSAAFFVASLVHFKIGITSLHLVLNGLLGLILGWAAFPAILIGLFLQTIFFGHGGLTVIGVNTANFGVSAFLCYLLFARIIRRSENRKVLFFAAFAAGSGAVLCNGLLIMLELFLTGQQFALLGTAFFLAHLPLAIIEGIITGFTVLFLKQARPKILESII